MLINNYNKMKLFKYNRIYNFIDITILGIKISHRIMNRNKYISLGTFCMPRLKLAQYRIKPYRKQGELSCPFDLCFIQLDSVAKILENDFADYFDDLYFDGEQEIWINKKYSIKYIHDNLNKKDFVDRYKNRIINFRNIIQNTKNLVFVQTLIDEVRNEDLYNNIKQINNYLRKHCKYKYKYKIINFIYDKESSDIFKSNIAENVFYCECQSPYDSNWTKWHEKETDENPRAKTNIKNFLDIIYYE